MGGECGPLRKRDDGWDGTELKGRDAKVETEWMEC